MITADADFVFFEGSKIAYKVVSIVVSFNYNSIQQTYLCEMFPAVVTASTSIAGPSYTYLITKAQVDAKTGTGTNPSDKIANQVDQVLADYLDAITENSAVTFTT